jgi:mono/diheme cytochrome c family protein
MNRFVWGLVVGVVAVPMLVMVYILSGYAPTAVTDRPIPLERFLAGGALHARTHREAPKRDLASFTTADLVAGAQVFRRGCGCHGLPQSAEQRARPVTFPPAPQLITPDGNVADDPVGVSYWKVKNGIRLTGMPSFKFVLSDEQMWQVAALVAKADKLPTEALDALKQPFFMPPPPPAAGAPASTPATAPGNQVKP